MTAYMTLYDATGKITGEAFGQEEVMPMIIANMGNVPFPQGHIMGKHFDDRDTKYVVDGVLADRPTNPAVLTGATLSALPVPCQIKINATTYDCTESTANLTFSHPGAYKITVIAWPHIDAEFTYVNPA